MIRVLIADDRQLVRHGVQALLSRARDIECVGEASDGIQAVELSARLMPDVILMDLKMPRLDGMGATAEICARPPHPRVLILAMSFDEDLVSRAVQNGARGYVTKLDMHTELVPAVRALYAGGSYFSAQIRSLLDGNLP